MVDYSMGYEKKDFVDSVRFVNKILLKSGVVTSVEVTRTGEPRKTKRLHKIEEFDLTDSMYDPSLSVGRTYYYFLFRNTSERDTFNTVFKRTQDLYLKSRNVEFYGNYHKNVPDYMSPEADLMTQNLDRFFIEEKTSENDSTRKIYGIKNFKVVKLRVSSHELSNNMTKEQSLFEPGKTGVFIDIKGKSDILSSLKNAMNFLGYKINIEDFCSNTDEFIEFSKEEEVKEKLNKYKEELKSKKKKMQELNDRLYSSSMVECIKIKDEIKAREKYYAELKTLVRNTEVKLKHMSNKYADDGKVRIKVFTRILNKLNTFQNWGLHLYKV